VPTPLPDRMPTPIASPPVRLPMNRPRRLRQGEPPIEHPARLHYLLTLLQQELSAAESGLSTGRLRFLGGETGCRLPEEEIHSSAGTQTKAYLGPASGWDWLKDA
jgi:hypothetical protein